MYFAAEDSPRMTQSSKTIYFELKILSMGGDHAGEAAGIAIGYCAKPYPSWRLPGWQRASLGVHGDDGRRFVNNSDGGVDFTKLFEAGETVGIGMTFTVSRNFENRGKTDAQVFFSRDGRRDQGWPVNEERDQESDNVHGLEGDFDLYAAIGVFGVAEFELQFACENWLYQP